MKSSSLKRRKDIDFLVRFISTASASVGLFALVWILYTVIRKGIGAINFDFFTQVPTPPGITGGGLANAIIGTILMTALAALVSVPIGIMGGVFLSPLLST